MLQSPSFPSPAQTFPDFCDQQPAQHLYLDTLRHFSLHSPQLKPTSCHQNIKDTSVTLVVQPKKPWCHSGLFFFSYMPPLILWGVLLTLFLSAVDNFSPLCYYLAGPGHRLHSLGRLHEPPVWSPSSTTAPDSLSQLSSQNNSLKAPVRSRHFSRLLQSQGHCLS